MSDYIRKSIRQIAGYVPGEQPHGESFIKLNTNENPYPPSPSVSRVMSKLDPSSLRLYPDPASHGLCDAIAGIHGCNPEQVLTGNGSDEILSLCIRAFVERGSGTVGYFDPSYSLYPVLCAIEEAETLPVALGPEFEWTMPDSYAASIFFMTYPNAPTGIQYRKSLVRDFCETFPGVVVIDEAYVDFAAEDAMELALAMDRVIVTRTLSKSYSLAGIRLGYAVGPAPLINAMYKIKDIYNINRITQEIGLAALSDQDYMRDIVNRIKATRERTANIMREMEFMVYPSDTNFLWVKPPRISAATLFESLREEKILVRYFPGKRTGNFLRITIGSDDEMDAFANTVERIIKR